MKLSSIRWAATAGARAARVPQLRVSELFNTIQGEGPHTGRPSIFLRLGMCNLECAWCDTKYTWLFDDEHLKKVLSNTPRDQHALVGDQHFDKSKELRKQTVEETMEAIEKLRLATGVGSSTVVITGGEPLLQKAALQSLVPLLTLKGYEIEVETNGTVSPRNLPRGIHYNVSPKLSNSYMPKEQRIKLKTLQDFLEVDSILKFVIANEEELAEVHELVHELKFPKNRVYLMPMGTDERSLQNRAEWLVQQCMENGYHYTHRLHVAIWGSKRGV